MGKFILRRLAQLVLVLFAVTFLTFSALNVVGDPLFNIVGLISGTDCEAVARGEIEDEVTGGNGETSCEIIAAAREGVQPRQVDTGSLRPVDRQHGKREISARRS